ncbi:hypothetical protein B0A55_07799 [Friedmanniomyces simplex]|uniref:F-box domain-containing protein n=1 Tax=Friedmanniomyces simplex TaxID=329884 RepID=A0A4U0X846_9PEZI|nr:hypothetical protein B0A55_07799 [Friedmanniomyces simplex]
MDAKDHQDPDLAITIGELEHSVQGLKTFFSDFLEPTLYTEKQPLDRQEGTPAAQRVLELPELLENVLQYLEIPDILRFQQVNRSACASVDGSPRLQSTLSLRPDPAGSPLRLPFADANLFPQPAGFICSSHGQHARPDTPEGQALVTAHFLSLVGQPLRIGARCRRIKVKSDTGITVGDLYDAMRKIQEEHRLCPHAARIEHGDDGMVSANVKFTALVQLRSDDPMFQFWRDSEAARVQRGQMRLVERSKRVEQNARISAYIAYKRTASADQAPIMTLKDCEEAGIVDEYLSIDRQRQQSRSQSLFHPHFPLNPTPPHHYAATQPQITHANQVTSQHRSLVQQQNSRQGMMQRAILRAAQQQPPPPPPPTVAAMPPATEDEERAESSSR